MIQRKSSHGLSSYLISCVCYCVFIFLSTILGPSGSDGMDRTLCVYTISLPYAQFNKIFPTQGIPFSNVTISLNFTTSNFYAHKKKLRS